MKYISLFITILFFIPGELKSQDVNNEIPTSLMSSSKQGTNHRMHKFSLTSGPLNSYYSHAGINYNWYLSKFFEIEVQIKLLGLGIAPKIHFLGTDRFSYSPYIGASFSTAAVLDYAAIQYYHAGIMFATKSRFSFGFDIGHANIQWGDFLSDSGVSKTLSASLEVEYCFYYSNKG